MLDTRFKAFSSFTELSEQGQKEYLEFQGLNNVIEKGGAQGYVDVFNSYVKVLLDSGKKDIDMSGYSELDFQIKYLMDEIRVPVNKILAFAECKFALIHDKLFGLLNQIYPISEEQKKEMLEVISCLRKGNIIIKILDSDYNEIESYILPFDIDGDFSENYLYMQEQISKISIMELRIKYGIVGLELGIMEIQA